MVLTESRGEFRGIAGFNQDNDVIEDDMATLASMMPEFAHVGFALVNGWLRYPYSVVCVRATFPGAPPLDQRAVQRHLARHPHPGRWTFDNSAENIPAALTFQLAQLALWQGVYLIDPSQYSENLPVNPEWDPLDPDESELLSKPVSTHIINFVVKLAAFIVTRPFSLAATRVTAQPLLEGGQYKYKGVFHAISQSYKEEGLTPFTRGFIISCTYYVLLDYITHYLQAHRNKPMCWLTRAWPTKNRQVLAIQHAACAALDSYLISMSAALLFRPLLIVSRHLDMQGTGMEAALNLPKYNNALDCTLGIIARYGIKGLFAGWQEDCIYRVAGQAAFGFVLDLALATNQFFRVKTYADW